MDGLRGYIDPRKFASKPETERRKTIMSNEAVAEDAGVPSKGEDARVRMNRREFLNFAWLASLGFLTLSMGGMTFLFAMPRFREGEFGGVVTVGRAGELPPVGSTPLNFPRVKVWLSNTDQGVVALYKVCTHLGCLYNWDSQEDKFICPCHGSEFEDDGEFIRGPAPRSLDRFAIEILDGEGRVIAETDSETGDPLPVPEDPNAVIRVDTGRRIIGRPV
jgi:cytochrome b6-f complex iron-sulfur subunit